MDNTVNVILIGSIICLTLVFIIVGVWLILLLKELRTTVKKINDTAEIFGNLGKSFSSPTDLFSGIIEGLKGAVELVAFVRGVKKDGKK